MLFDLMFGNWYSLAQSGFSELPANEAEWVSRSVWKVAVESGWDAIDKYFRGFQNEGKEYVSKITKCHVGRDRGHCLRS